MATLMRNWTARVRRLSLPEITGASTSPSGTALPPPSSQPPPVSLTLEPPSSSSPPVSSLSLFATCRTQTNDLPADGYNLYKSATGATLDHLTGLLMITSTQYANLQSLFFTAGGT